MQSSSPSSQHSYTFLQIPLIKKILEDYIETKNKELKTWLGIAKNFFSKTFDYTNAENNIKIVDTILKELDNIKENKDVINIVVEMGEKAGQMQRASKVYHSTGFEALHLARTLLLKNIPSLSTAIHHLLSNPLGKLTKEKELATAVANHIIHLTQEIESKKEQLTLLGQTKEEEKKHILQQQIYALERQCVYLGSNKYLDNKLLNRQEIFPEKIFPYPAEKKNSSELPDYPNFLQPDFIETTLANLAYGNLSNLKKLTPISIFEEKPAVSQTASATLNPKDVETPPNKTQPSTLSAEEFASLLYSTVVKIGEANRQTHKFKAPAQTFFNPKRKPPTIILKNNLPSNNSQPTKPQQSSFQADQMKNNNP